ncbi:MAG: SagB/ThcOx family dehydrogenase [Melioribacteraceae bacterium]|nr:SagB/ThcOx family dehydrogenase [Melioribacteraceae bacterium]
MFTITKKFSTIMFALLIIYAAGDMKFSLTKNKDQTQTGETIQLPDPNISGSVSVENAISKRRSVRNFQNKSLTLQQISQLLWSAQGITSRDGLRAAPSAGALYPLEIYVVAGNVENLDPGVYRYIPKQNQLIKTSEGDKRSELVSAASNQEWIADAPVLFVFSVIYERTTGKYGQRGIRYVHMDTGFAGENLFLQAVALNLSSVVVGAFRDEQVKRVLLLDENENPMIIMPVGYKR